MGSTMERNTAMPVMSLPTSLDAGHLRTQVLQDAAQLGHCNACQHSRCTSLLQCSGGPAPQEEHTMAVTPPLTRPSNGRGGRTAGSSDCSKDSRLARSPCSPG